MERREFVMGTNCALAVALAGCLSGGGGGGGGGQVVATTDVTMRNSQFDPRNIEVDAGAEVTWTNEDGSKHTVSAASENWTFDREVASGKSVSRTFEESGVYDVYCRFHGESDLSGMSMKIAVGEATIDDPLGGGGGSY